MAGILGPNSYLPGRIINNPKLGEKHTCDECEQPAVAAIIGETDSFGSEYSHVCQVHLDEHLKRVEAKEAEDPKEYCDHCKNYAKDVKPIRYADEGMNGPVYYLCKTHRARVNSENNEFYDDYESDRYDE